MTTKTNMQVTAKEVSALAGEQEAAAPAMPPAGEREAVASAGADLSARELVQDALASIKANAGNRGLSPQMMLATRKLEAVLALLRSKQGEPRPA